MTIRTGKAAQVGLTLALLVTGANAQDGAPVQLLDRVESISPTTVVEMTFNDPARTVDFFPTGATGQSLTHCALTGNKGRFCLDGRLVRRWSNPTDGSTVTTEFSCADRALGLNTSKPDTCSALSAGLGANVLIAGRTPNNSYRLIEVFPKPAAGCSSISGSQPLTGVTNQDTSNFANYCFRTIAADLGGATTDLVVIDGSVGADFPGGPGVLALVNGNTVLFFGQGPPVTIASGKSAWSLNGNEALLQAAVYQRGDPVENYVLATTTTGRIMKRTVGSAAVAAQVFNIPSARVVPPGQQPCSSSTQRYGIRTKSEIVIVTDRQFCQVIALQANATFSSLVNAQEGPVGNTHNLTLSTREPSPSSTSYPPISPAIAPGISVDLLNCGANEPSCPFTLNNVGEPTAVLSEVVLDPSTPNTFMTVLLIELLPDCRYIPENDWCEQKFAEQGTMLPDGREGPRVIVMSDDSLGDPTEPGFQPQEAYLNVAALFPQVVYDMMKPEILPEMLIQPLHRGAPPPAPGQPALADPPNHFAGFFGITDPNILFRNNFNFVVDIGQLTGTQSACGLGGPHPNLKWHLVTAVSERVATVAGPNNDAVDEGEEFVDQLLNTSCVNPTGSKGGGRWSFYAVNLTPTDTGDSVYARLLDSIFTDLESTRAQVLCTTNDGDDEPPLSGTVCSSLQSRWDNAKTKLDSCIDGSIFPRQSQAINNCNAFRTQLINYRDTLNGAVRLGLDSANRIGEQKGRVEVIFHVFDDHFIPSIPLEGFVDPL